MYYMYNYSSPNGPAVALGIAFVLSLIGGIILYFTFLNKNNEHKYSGFVKWLYDFLSFQKLMIDSILKILYLILACFITLAGIIMMVYSFLTGLFLLVVGNVLLRLGYEFMMLLIIICQNTIELNKKLGANNTSAEFVSDFGIPHAGHPGQHGSDMKTQTTTWQTQAQPQAATQQSQMATQQAQTQTQTQEQEADAETNGQKICPKCGASLPADALFCGNCGEKQ